MPENEKSWKERFENHPVIFGVTLLIIGFVSGFGVNEWTFNFRDYYPVLNTSSISIQIESLTLEHNNRLTQLHKELKNNEREAVNNGHIDSVQEKYMMAAQRIRQSIAEENISYKTHLEQLMRIADAPGT